MSTRIAIVGVAAFCGIGLAWATQPPAVTPVREKPERVLKAEKVLAEHLESLKASHGQVIWINAAQDPKVFPGKESFFAVRFRQFPVARVLPAGLSASNVFVVTEGGKAERLADVSALQKFFQQHMAPVKDEAQAKNAVTVWLNLSQEYRQDGFFLFEILGKEIEVTKSDEGMKATGRAMVARGGNGELRVTLALNPEGTLRSAVEDAKIRPGPRPICQATKLLDPDPIVRRMAEQDLLIMGVAAHDYLQEQRARATPELRQAIDRLWRRISAQP
jgi:hypothetical protein